MTKTLIALYGLRVRVLLRLKMLHSPCIYGKCGVIISVPGT